MRATGEVDLTDTNNRTNVITQINIVVFGVSVTSMAIHCNRFYHRTNNRFFMLFAAMQNQS